MAISRRLRYEVLRRDSYTCRYCGAKAPDVKLNVDAVVPEALGGSHKDPANLITACEACNGGKTSSSPDAPLVADIAEHALEWAQAMRQAQGRALADLKAREAGRGQFAEWWDSWTYEHEGKRHPLPRPGDWEQTVDQLVASGLPLPLLKDCIDRAMGRTKVQNSEKFRYMCGVAWRKLTELQEAARSLAGAPQGGSGEEGDPALARGRAGFARELLGQCDEEEIDRLKAEAREDRGAVTDDEQHVEALQVAWQEARMGYSWLAYSICDLLPTIPDQVIRTAMRDARHELYDENGEDFSRAAFAERTIDAAMRGYRAKRDAEYLAAMPEDERAEWIAYANAAFGNGGELAGRSAVLYPAACARSIKQGRLYRGMCLARGQHIERCPARAAYYVRFAEFTCCHGSDDEHEEHVFCEEHVELALAGELRRNDSPVTVIGYKAIPDADLAEMAVPF